MGTDLSIYLELLRDEKRLAEIGSNVVKDSLKRVMHERLDVRDDDVMFVLKQGDAIPASLKTEPEIRITPAGLAAADWCKAWCKGGDWGGNCWGKCTGDRLPYESGFYAKTQLMVPSARELFDRLMVERFSQQELAMLREQKIL